MVSNAPTIFGLAIFGQERSARLPGLVVPIALAAGLAGCVADAMPSPDATGRDAHLAALDMYRAAPDELHPIAAVDLAAVDPAYLRQEVDYDGDEPADTIVIHTGLRFLYLVEGNGRALRYGIGVGKDGMRWSGRAEIARKAQWPRWTPTPEMVRRNPALNRPFATGMASGIDNPLGARALYLYADGKDTLYRIHGTSDPSTIGRAVSSGCIRMLNQDVIDLYRRVPIGTKVIVRDGASRPAQAVSQR